MTTQQKQKINSFLEFFIYNFIPFLILGLSNLIVVLIFDDSLSRFFFLGWNSVIIGYFTIRG